MRVRVSRLAAWYVRRNGGNLYVWEHQVFVRDGARDFELWLEKGFARPARLHLGLTLLPRIGPIATTTWYDGSYETWDDLGPDKRRSRA